MPTATDNPTAIDPRTAVEELSALARAFEHHLSVVDYRRSNGLSATDAKSLALATADHMAHIAHSAGLAPYRFESAVRHAVARETFAMCEAIADAAFLTARTNGRHDLSQPNDGERITAAINRYHRAERHLASALTDRRFSWSDLTRYSA